MLLLTAMFLFALGTFNKTGLILSIVLVVFLTTNLKISTRVDTCLMLFAVFSLFYFLDYRIYWPVGGKEIIIFLISPWACYFLGREYVINNGEKHAIYLAVAVAGGFFIHGLLNLMAVLDLYGMDYSGRISYDFWQKRVIAATGCSLYYTALVSMAVAWLFFSKKLFLKILSIVIIAIGIFSSIIYSTRALIVLMFILMLFAECLSVLSVEYNSVNTSKVLVVTLVILAFLFVSWKINLFGLQTKILSLDVTRRLLNSQSRTELWRSFLTNHPLKYPLGGNQVQLSGGAKWVHNLWLDTFRTAGVVPFLLLCVITVVAIGKGITYWKNICKDGVPEYASALFMMFGVALNSMVEPIMDANPYVFLAWCMGIGIINGYNELAKAS